MVAAGFVVRVKRAHAIVNEEEAQRATRVVAKSIEMLFRCGAYTEAMDAARETRASRILAPKGRTLEIKEKAPEIEVKFDEARPSPSAEQASWQGGNSMPVPTSAITGILSSIKDELDAKEAAAA